MKLKKEFITHEMGDSHVMVATGNANFSGLVRSNETASFIVEMLKEETTKEAIVDAMNEKYNATKDVIAHDVDIILDKLRSIGALDE